MLYSYILSEVTDAVIRGAGIAGSGTTAQRRRRTTLPKRCVSRASPAWRNLLRSSAPLPTIPRFNHYLNICAYLFLFQVCLKSVSCTLVVVFYYPFDLCLSLIQVCTKGVSSTFVDSLVVIYYPFNLCPLPHSGVPQGCVQHFCRRHLHRRPRRVRAGAPRGADGNTAHPTRHRRPSDRNTARVDESAGASHRC